MLPANMPKGQKGQRTKKHRCLEHDGPAAFVQTGRMPFRQEQKALRNQSYGIPDAALKAFFLFRRRDIIIRKGDGRYDGKDEETGRGADQGRAEAERHEPGTAGGEAGYLLSGSEQLGEREVCS